MKFLEAITLLGKVHKNDSNMYIESLADHTGDGSLTLAMKRKSSDKVAVLREYYFVDDSLLAFDFKECIFLYTGKDGKTMPYPFECADFVADDWECVIYDCDGEYNYSALKGKISQTFAEFLINIYSDAILDYDSAIKKAKEFFTQNDGSEISRIDIYCVFGDKRETLSGAMQTIKDWHLIDTLNDFAFCKDELFEISIMFKDGNECDLALWEAENDKRNFD